MDIVNEFYNYRVSIGDRVALYRKIVKKFKIKSALYPGSHIDIMPSFVIPHVTYIDNFKGSINFFKDINSIVNFVEENKEYEDDCTINFFGEDYRSSFEIEQVDLLISQFAGFIGQDTKQYLKKGGILLCNDSHGDATLACCDNDYEFIGVVNSKNEIETKDLEKYFEFARKRPINIEEVKAKMKGPKYKYKAYNYIFKKL